MRIYTLTLLHITIILLTQYKQKKLKVEEKFTLCTEKQR